MAERDDCDMMMTAGSGNVFAHLGVAETQEELAKARLASHIGAAIGLLEMTQARAGALMGLDQPKVSALMNGRLTRSSSDGLLQWLSAIGQYVGIAGRGRRSRAAVVGCEWWMIRLDGWGARIRSDEKNITMRMDCGTMSAPSFMNGVQHAQGSYTRGTC